MALQAKAHVKAASDPAPAIHLSGVHLVYRDQALFEDLALVLPAGRTTCLLGASGVGKTSLLRLVAGLADDIQGVVTDQDGRALTGRIAYMAQHDLLLPWNSVLNNVVLGARLRGEQNLAETKDRAMALLAQVKLADRAQDRPADLSIGMRQRVALARTLIEDRPIVLMDEPFSALDAITRFELQDLAAELLYDRSVLLVTHDPLEALRLGHVVYVLSGRPVRFERPLEIEGSPPRDPAGSTLLALQAKLLKSLAQAGSPAA